MKVPSTDVQNNFGKYLKFVEANEEIIVTKNGRDVAKIVPCDDWNGDRLMESSALYRASGDWVTYEQFLELSEGSEQRFELIDGVVYNLASPTYKHQHAVGELFVTFYNYFKGKSCIPLTSPFDITLTKEEDNICVVQPDIVVICDPDNRDKRDKYTGVPVLAVEVLSPSTRGKDLVTKLDLYKQCGVREYWLVDPMNEQIFVYQFADRDIVNNKGFDRSAEHRVQSFYFEGLGIALSDIFE
ncbi:type II toxin-antitoxin system prevent-host-death family antitoxin [Paenibacillus sp. LHD-117]|uniref:type II toxin-antitoxin system prevent-host-death family antitoxin n=1 Tax=Paenibacillus sp. LHD-117 TaxID=3071412 RepID=UPI0027DEB4ED|nr:type II toxin-antitoxin system prevent-host-death family antitoxin [Paenibacillus sp. LHD-117]MDQ6420283.1 type II toxin-antitoxin system prevent-host-death family antitoxin [Paenibacillus sp. LHD-117]